MRGQLGLCLGEEQLLSQEGRILAPLPGEEMGGVRVCGELLQLCQLTLATPRISGAWAWVIRNILAYLYIHPQVTFSTHPCPNRHRLLQPAGQDIGPGLFPGFKSQLCLLLALWLGR